MTDYNELWCPMVRVQKFAPGGAATNQDTRCIGPKCAMWRWSNKARDRNGDWVIIEPSGVYGSVEKRGFCGLAGHPEYLP